MSLCAHQALIDEKKALRAVAEHATLAAISVRAPFNLN